MRATFYKYIILDFLCQISYNFEQIIDNLKAK